MGHEEKKLNIVLSTNDNPIYFPFLEKTVNLYKQLGHNVYVSYVTKKTNPDLSHLPVDQILYIQEVSGFESGIQAKLARTFFAAQIEKHVPVTLLDVDQFVINFKWLQDNINNNISDRYDLLAFGANGYKMRDGSYNPNICGKFALYFTTAYPSGFKKLLNITSSTSFEDLLHMYSSINNPRDGYECTKNKFKHFSDESLFAWLIREHNISCKHIDMPDWNFCQSKRRIDRNINIMLNSQTPGFDKNFWYQNKLTEQQRQLIMDDYFIDVFPNRPYITYSTIIDDIIDTIIHKETN